MVGKEDKKSLALKCCPLRRVLDQMSLCRPAIWGTRKKWMPQVVVWRVVSILKKRNRR